MGSCAFAWSASDAPERSASPSQISTACDAVGSGVGSGSSRTFRPETASLPLPATGSRLAIPRLAPGELILEQLDLPAPCSPVFSTCPNGCTRPATCPRFVPHAACRCTLVPLAYALCSVPPLNATTYCLTDETVRRSAPDGCSGCGLPSRRGDASPGAVP